MAIRFTCPSCGRSFSVDESFAGKRAKCKLCGGVNRIPEPEPAADGLSADELYGLDEGPAASVMPPIEAAPMPPSRARAGFSTSKPKRAAKKGEPWGIGLRRGACAFVVIGMVVNRGLRIAAKNAEGSTFVTLLAFAVLILMTIGVILILISLVGMTVSFAGGNRRAFAGEAKGDVAGFIFACVLSALFIVVSVMGLTGRIAGVAQVARAGPGGRPGLLPAAGGVPGPPPGVGAPPFAPGRGTQSDIKVSLSNGRFMNKTSAIGTAQPGVEISVDYQMEAGAVRPPEHLVLVIKSSKGRGELDNLFQMQMNRSGTIHASSFMAKPEEGPYEAWVEVASRPGPGSDRKKVSEAISLQFTDVPVRDLAAELNARAAAGQAKFEQQRQQMEQQRQQMQNRMGFPGGGPGGPPMGPTGPMGRGGRMGPMGPRGGRPGAGPR